MTGLQLQGRDLEILDALATWGAMDADSITRRWFSSRDKARKRLMRLVGSGHCRRMLIARNVPAVYHVGAFNSTSLHTAAVNGARVALWERGDLLVFEPEVEFIGTKHRADALVTWRRDQGEATTFFLEVDLATESGGQIREKVRGYLAYYRSGRWQQHWTAFPPIVWAADQARLRHLLRWVHQVAIPDGIRCWYGLQSLWGPTVEEGGVRS